MRRLLLCGFEPFGTDSVNPTLKIIEQLDGHRLAMHDQPDERFEIITCRVPVTRYAAIDSVIEAIGEHAGVVHLTVTFVNPNVLLRLTGGLGPLGLLGVDGNMTWEFFDAEEGTTVRFAYVVGGYRPGGLDEMAGPVDHVIGEALRRLKAFVETGDPASSG